MGNSRDHKDRHIFVVTSGTSLDRNMKKLQAAFAQSDQPGRDDWGNLLEKCLSPQQQSPGEKNSDPSVAETARWLLNWGNEQHLPKIGVSPGCDDAFIEEAAAGYFQGMAELLAVEEASGEGTTGDPKPTISWLSAELTSLFSTGEGHPKHPEPGDHIVLVATDTPVGERYARIVGQILSARVGGKTTSVRIEPPEGGLPHPNSAELADALSEPGATVAVVSGMNFTEPNFFARTAPGIAEILATAYVAAGKSRSGELVIHPIGGLKETIPVVSTLAAHLPLDGRADVSMWYANEKSHRAIQLPLLRVGLPVAELWDLDVIDASKGEPMNSSDLRTRTWAGYAWLERAGKLELSYVGWGVLRIRAIADSEG